jgi:O-antigen ligase
VSGRERWLGHLAFAGLFVWAVGTELNEGIATAGIALTGLAVIASLVAGRDGPGRAFLLRCWPLFAYVAWACCGGLLFGRVPTGTGLSRALTWCALPLGAWALAASSVRQRRILAGAVGVTFGLSIVVAALQFTGHWPSLEAFAPLRFTKVPFQHVYEPVPNSPGHFMGGGLLFHRLKFAHVGALTALFALGVALESKGRRRAIAWGVAGVGAFAVARFPFARAAVVALLLAAAALGVLWSRRRLMAMIVASLLVIAAAVGVAASPGMRARFSASLSGEGSGHRIELWETGLRAVRSAPLVGVGTGRFVPHAFAAEDTPPDILALNAKSHNQFITVAAESGLVGLLLYLGMLLFLAREIWARSPARLGAMGGLLFFVLISFLHDPLFHPVFHAALMLALAAGMADKRWTEQGLNERPAAPQRPVEDAAPQRMAAAD